MNSISKLFSVLPPLVVVLALGACTTMPAGPSVMVLPGTGKSFDQFRADDVDCRQFAAGQAGSAADAANDSGVRSAALGTVVGALAGAAINGSHGAGVGAGAGLLMGSLAGSDAANMSGHAVQRRYDFSYQQCMYAKGHKVPSSGRFMNEPGSGAAPNAGYPYPPPPPGSYPR